MGLLETKVPRTTGPTTVFSARHAPYPIRGGLGRGRPRGGAQVAQSQHRTVDRRPRTIAVEGFDESEREAVVLHFGVR